VELEAGEESADGGWWVVRGRLRRAKKRNVPVWNWASERVVISGCDQV
jgi:hypothetical protein